MAGSVNALSRAGAGARRRMPLLARRSFRRALQQTIVYAILLAGAAVLLIPLVWLLSSSLKPTGRIFMFPPQWIPDPVEWRNYTRVWQAIPLLLFLRNTLTITFFAVLGTCLSASLVAFGFARMRFPYRDTVFMIVLATMMIPGQVTLIPTYILFRVLKWIDTFLPLIVPAYFGGGAFNIFLMRQFYMRLPLELDDAARIDGCNSFGIYRLIVLPQAKPVLGVIAIFGFMAHWNEFFGPLIYLNSMHKYTLALGLNLLRASQFGSTDWGMLMAASTMIALPPIGLYFIAQRYFIQGIVFTGLKQ